MAVVTPAEPSNVEVMATLFEEMDRFYGATDIDPVDVRVRQIKEALFSDPMAAHAVLAWEGGTLVGFAAYSFLWPAVGLTRSLYLKELYVSQSHRRAGIGTQLMQSLCEIAVKHQCSRVEWTTDTDNADAQKFYEHIGVSQDRSKILYRVEGQELLQATKGRYRG